MAQRLHVFRLREDIMNRSLLVLYIEPIYCIFDRSNFANVWEATGDDTYNECVVQGDRCDADWVDAENATGYVVNLR